jgi:uncharacterized protein (TIGR00290 family)
MTGSGTPAILCWSGGKDACLALHALREEGRYDVRALLTTVTEDYDRISMHGVRRTLLERQAESVGLPLAVVGIAAGDGDAAYAAKMERVLARFRAEGIAHAAFGDLFLEDVRAWRETQLARAGFTGVFPLWKRPTDETAQAFLAAGFRAVVTCADTEALDGSFSGRDYDESFLAELPEGVDPCGERGEFHTFAHAGPVFREPIRFSRGERVLRSGRFLFTDLQAL